MQFHNSLGQLIAALVKRLIQNAVKDFVLYLVGNGNSGFLDQQAKQLGGAQAEAIA